MSTRQRILACLVPCLAMQGALASDEPARPATATEGGWRQFVVYPHVEKGWQAVRQGRRDRAIAEFRRAYELAPTNALLARYLASAHRHFGELPAAVGVLRGQLKHTPQDAAVRVDLFHAMYAQLPAKGAPRAGALASWIAVERDEATRDRLTRELGYLKAQLASADKVQASVAAAQPPAAAAPPQAMPKAASAAAVQTARAAPAQRRAAVSRSAQAPSILRAPPDKAELARAEFDAALARKDYAAAEGFAMASMAQPAAQPGLLDSMTYRLTEAGADRVARNLLMTGYPFARSPTQERERLLERLMRSIVSDPEVPEASQWDRLRAPLDTPQLRSLQAVFWATMRDCDGVRAVLADSAGDRGYSDWMRLGNCYRAREPGLAQNAFERASTLRPEPEAIKSLAYQAYANADHAAALQAWQRLGVDALSPDELLAAARTAWAANAPGPMRQWLDAYLAANPAGSPEYRSLEADILEASQRRPEAEATKALAYQAYADADHAAALVAWQRLDVDALSPDELLAAARTASAANASAPMRLWLAAFIARSPADSPEYWSLEAESLEKTDAAGAAAALERAIALRPQATYYMRLARLQRDPAAKLRHLESAALLAPADADVQAELGYAYLAAGDPGRAVHALEAARAGRPDDANLLEQLIYVHERLANNETARQYARLRLDALSAVAEGPTGKPATPPTEDPAEQRFRLMRLHEALGRRVTVSLDTIVGTATGGAGAAGTPAGQPGQGFRSYSQLEVDYRLGTPPIQDGRTLSAYLRVFADRGAQDSVSPDSSSTLGVGLRWKPLRDQVLFLAVERQVPLQGDGRQSEWLLRASASFLNSGRYSDDWHPSGAGWVAQSIYLDIARYTQSRRTAATADYRVSYHHKIAPGQTVEPFAHVQYNAIRQQELQRDVRIGVGVRWNLWHGATRYDAYPHKLVAAIEIQRALTTYLPDRKAVFFSLAYRW